MVLYSWIRDWKRYKNFWHWYSHPSSNLTITNGRFKKSFGRRKSWIILWRWRKRIDRLAVQSVHPRTRVHWTMDRAEDGLLIRVKGYPEPVITWKFNDQILNPYVHNITKNGQVLTISKGPVTKWLSSFDPGWPEVTLSDPKQPRM